MADRYKVRVSDVAAHISADNSGKVLEDWLNSMDEQGYSYVGPMTTPFSRNDGQGSFVALVFERKEKDQPA